MTDVTASRVASLAAIERFRFAAEKEPLVEAAFLGGSYAAGREREDSDIDVYLIVSPSNYGAFLGKRRVFMDSWCEPVRLKEIWNFEGLGFDMIAFELVDGVRGELALGTTENYQRIHGGPHRVLVDKHDILRGVHFPLR